MTWAKSWARNFIASVEALPSSVAAREKIAVAKSRRKRATETARRTARRRKAGLDIKRWPITSIELDDAGQIIRAHRASPGDRW